MSWKNFILGSFALAALGLGIAYAQAPLNPALTGPQFGNSPALGPNTPLGTHPLTSPVSPQQAQPVGTTCTIVSGSTDTAGRCAATATSGVAVTFANAYNGIPYCVVQDQTTFSGNALAARSATGFTMGTTVSGDIISWVCLGGPGG